MRVEPRKKSKTLTQRQRAAQNYGASRGRPKQTPREALFYPAPWPSGAPRTARSPRGCKSHPGNGRLAR